MGAPVLLSENAAQALAQHLRENPHAVLQQPNELASDFGLPEDFVKEVLKGIKGESRAPYHRSSSGVWKSFRSVGHAIRDLFLFLTRRPLLFLGLTTAGATAFGLWFEPPIAMQVVGKQARHVLPMWGFLVTLTCLVLHLLTYYRHGRARVAAMGALVGWLITTPVLMILFWQTLGKQEDMVVSVALLSVALTMLFVWTFYAGAAMVAAVVGGYVHLRRETRTEQRLTRQQRLERLFEVQGKLAAGSGEDRQPGRQIWLRWGRPFVRRPWLMSGVLGFAINAGKMVLMLGAVMLVQKAPALVPLAIGAGLLTFLAQMVGFATVGYFATSAARAMLMGVVFIFFSYLADILAILLFESELGTITVKLTEGSAEPQPSPWEGIVHVPGLILNFAFGALLPLVAWAGAQIEEKALKELRLKREEPSALLAEMVRIQWLLAPAASNICIMVVDAARSAEMKAAADPLKVEYSFREYQNLIDRLARGHGGHVHNTAGDGAVVAFNTCEEAFTAARKLQTEIATFNSDVNRLDTAFRLRIGLHQGMIAGELEKVEFTEVIDIAAHVQGAAPVGGIAITESVRPYVGEHPFAQIQGTIDGCNVFIAMNPTLDA